MLDTNHKNSSCAFAEQLVSYLYDEASEQEKTVFEKHLTTCKNCAGELSAFGFARSAVQQWRTAEFLPLPIPVMEIPFEKSSEISVKITEKSSRFTGWRQLFAFSPGWAAASAAVVLLAVCVGLIFTAVDFSDSNKLAESNKITPEKSIISPAGENKTEQNTKTDFEEIAKQSSSDKIAEPLETKSEIKNSPQVTPKTSVEKVLNKTKRTPKNELAARNSNSSAPIRKIKDSNNINQSAVAKNLQMPKLADFDEMEDNSLRLADLMAEVEDK